MSLSSLFDSGRKKLEGTWLSTRAELCTLPHLVHQATPCRGLRTVLIGATK